ncbi:MAG: DNA starvation/stationary phase protection protein [Bacteroidota bacterium]
MTPDIKISNIQIGISQPNREAVSEELGKLLANEYVLYTQTRNAHWNVTGPDFVDKHKFFEEQYTQLDEIIDNVAERIRSLGQPTPASLKKFIELSDLVEDQEADTTSVTFISELLAGHEQIIQSLRENIIRFAEDYSDLGTSDFITGLMEEHEKMAWFLRAHLS